MQSRLTWAVVVALVGLGGGSVLAQAAVQIARVEDGLVALLVPDPDDPTRLRDASGTELPLSLVARGSGGLFWPGASLPAALAVGSDGPATALCESLRTANGFTLEAWLRPENLTQGGPSRIATLSEGTANDRNLTFGQESGRYILRLRTSDRTDYREYQTPDGIVATTAQHVVVVFQRCPTCGAGNAVVYVDGDEVLREPVSGDLSTWSDYPLTLGNESTHDRPWRGTLGLVAFYNRGLTPAEVVQNQVAGCAW